MIKRALIGSFFFFLLCTWETFGQKYYYEENSIVIVEMESVPVNGWLQGETTVNGKMIKYIYSTQDYFNTPGKNSLEYKIMINNPGVYQFRWHCKVGKGNSSTDCNDNWLRIPDAADFYASKGSHVVHPHGKCTNDCPNGAGSNGWFKLYSSGSTNWTWQVATSDNEPHEVYAKFDQPGIYTVQVSTRSAYQFLDRFVLFNKNIHTLSQATNLQLPESRIFTTANVESPNTINRFVIFPNPAYDEITILSNGVKVDNYQVVNAVGQTVAYKPFKFNAEKLNISGLVSGYYYFRFYSDGKLIHTSTLIKCNETTSN